MRPILKSNRGVVSLGASLDGDDIAPAMMTIAEARKLLDLADGAPFDAVMRQKEKLMKDAANNKERQMEVRES